MRPSVKSTTELWPPLPLVPCTDGNEIQNKTRPMIESRKQDQDVKLAQRAAAGSGPASWFSYYPEDLPGLADCRADVGPAVHSGLTEVDAGRQETQTKTRAELANSSSKLIGTRKAIAHPRSFYVSIRRIANILSTSSIHSILTRISYEMKKARQRVLNDGEIRNGQALFLPYHLGNMARKSLCIHRSWL
jgi:hypothetical protein